LEVDDFFITRWGLSFDFARDTELPDSFLDAFELVFLLDLLLALSMLDDFFLFAETRSLSESLLDEAFFLVAPSFFNKDSS